MFSVRLQNVRSFLDTEEIVLKPLTILVGKNNSGKSTFTRFFPLLKQSLEVRSNAAILWFGELVDFGSVKEVKSRFSGSENIRFDLKVDAELLRKSRFQTRVSRTRSILAELPTISFGLEMKEIENTTHVCCAHLTLNDDTVGIHISTEGLISRVTVNGRDYSKHFPAELVRIDNRHLVPSFLIQVDFGDNRKDWIPARAQGLEPVRRELRTIYRRWLHGALSNETLNRFVASGRYAPREKFLELLGSVNTGYASWRGFVDNLGGAGEYQKNLAHELRELYLLRDLPEVLAALESVFTSIFLNVGYIGPTRATGERFYRIQELAVDQIDPRGENLAMFLNSLDPNDQRDFREWTGKYLGYGVIAERYPGHISLMLRERGSENVFNLADVGYGLSQILPVMAQMWAQGNLSKSRTPLDILAIEQPELHLHPAYQAMIGDALVGILNDSIEMSAYETISPMSLIVETHSQPLIARIGQLIGEKKFSADQVAIYVFDKQPTEDATRVSRASFDDEGDLRDWPFGFFSSAS